jgi:hypothetical protein
LNESSSLKPKNARQLTPASGDKGLRFAGYSPQTKLSIASRELRKKKQRKTKGNDEGYKGNKGTLTLFMSLF